jgi:hypothetical protein
MLFNKNKGVLIDYRDSLVSWDIFNHPAGENFGDIFNIEYEDDCIFLPSGLILNIWTLKRIHFCPQ